METVHVLLQTTVLVTSTMLETNVNSRCVMERTALMLQRALDMEPVLPPTLVTAVLVMQVLSASCLFAMEPIVAILQYALVTVYVHHQILVIVLPTMQVLCVNFRYAVD